MFKKFIFLNLILLCFCLSMEASSEFDKYFQNRKGCFLLWNMSTKSFEKVMGGETCREQFPAASTFKVPLAVMAFDSKILKDENQILKWDGIKWFKASHNHDHNAKTWMRDSVVWFSKKITTQMGVEKLQKYLNEFNYGNKDISAGLTKAWLVTPSNPIALKISAYEQIEFMQKLWTNSLPVSQKAMQLTQEITFLERSPLGFDLYGKTGSNYYDKEKKKWLGWFVSHLKKDKQSYLTATTFSDLSPSKELGFGGPKAKEITKKILTDLKLW